MELPAELKELYRHWSRHTTNARAWDRHIPQPLRTFISERVRIWERKTAGESPPYTNDPILARYRFCNIYRELDRQTIEYHRLLNPLRHDFPLWLLNMFYARMVARPETVRAVGLLSYDNSANAALYARLCASPRPRYGPPYVFPVSTILKSETPTREFFITRHLPRVMPGIAAEIERWRDKPVADGVLEILPPFGFNLHFLWTEVLIDTAYQFPDRINLFGRFPIGPGAAPTFTQLTNGDPSSFVAELAAERMTTDISYEGAALALSAENWEGIGCEFRKYSNLSRGMGRRRIFRPPGGEKRRPCYSHSAI